MRYHLAIESQKNSDPSPDREFASRQAIVLMVLLIVGAALALAALPRLFATIPNELGRFRTVLRALKTIKSPIIVFGDSRGASGIDASQLTRKMAGHPLALNLSTPGMMLDSLLLLMQEVPVSTRVLVLILGRDHFLFKDFSSAVYNAMFMYGYRPNDQTIQSMSDALGVKARREIRRPVLAEVAESRWIARQAPEMLLHDAVRGRARRLRERDDLYFPMPYEQRLDTARFAAQISVFRRGVPNAPMSSTGRRLLQAIALAAARKNQRVVVVIAPMHSLVFGACPPPPFAAPDTFPNLTVLDATSFLNDADFADPIHPTPAGARKLTSLVARRLGQLN